MASRLISSFGLPVAVATGRLVVWTLETATRRPLRLVVALALPASMVTCGLALVGVRRRFASRRASRS